MCKKVILTILLALFILLVPGGNTAAMVETAGESEPAVLSIQPGEELVAERTRTSKTYWLGAVPNGQRYALDASIGSVHYKDDLDDPLELWKEIDTTIVPSDHPYWNYEVVKGNWHLLIKNDTTVALGNDGNWIIFQYEGLAYLDWNTKDYEILATRASVTPVVTANKIRWVGIFPGCNLEYIYGPDGFKENLEVTQQARDWAAANPPSSFNLNNTSTYLGGYIKCDWQDAYQAEDAYGQPVDFDEHESITSSIFWRHPVKDKIVTALPIGYATHEDLQPDEWERIRYRFTRYGDDNYLLFGAKVPNLNLYPAGTIIIDPTIDEQVGAGADDGRQARGVYFSATEQSKYIGQYDGNLYDNFARWTGISIEGTIDVSYIEIYGKTVLSPLVKVYGIDEDNPPAPTNLAEMAADPLTTAGVDWDEPTNGTTQWYDSPSLNAIFQELVDTYTISNDAVMLQLRDDGSPNNNYWVIYFYELAPNDKGAKLHIEYTAGGVVIPTVTSDNSTSVEETTATCNGNITNAGGENCTARFIQYGTSTGSYTDNETESGDYPAGIFSLGLTSLSPGTTYYWRVGATNSEGNGYGSELYFTTKPEAPTSITDTARTSTQITLTWTLGTGSENTTIRYRSDGTYPTDYNDGTNGYNGTAATCNITALTAGQEYKIRAWAVNTDNVTIYSDNSDELTAFTLPADPTSASSSNMTCTTADVAWTLGTGSDESVVRWKEGSYPTDETDGTSGYGPGSANLTTVTSLPISTTIYFGIFAYDTESSYYSSGSAQTSNTTAGTAAPTVTTTDNATGITAGRATVSGNITDIDCQNASIRGFDIGSACDNFTDNWTAGGSFGTGSYSHEFAGLSGNTTYFFRARAYNDGGWGYGACGNFTTLAGVEVVTVALTAPLNFTATYITDFHVRLTWDRGTNAVNTMVRARYGEYPADRNDGYQVYYGNGESYDDTLVYLFMRDNDIRYRAWSENPSLSWSTDYAQDTVGGASMLTLIQVFLIVGLMAIAFWQKNVYGMLLFLVVAAISFFSGLTMYDQFDTSSSLAVGISLIANSLFCLGIAFHLLWRKRSVEEQEG